MMSDEKEMPAHALDEILPCPACDRPTPARELANFSGVCQFCKRGFLVANHTWIEDPTKRDHGNDGGHSAVPFQDGLSGGALDFDFAALDAAVSDFTTAPDEARAQAAELVSRILVFVWRAGTAQTALSNLCGFTLAVRPDLLGRDEPQIGRELRISKQAVSKALQRAEEFFGVTLFHRRSRAGRENMRLAALRSHAARRALKTHGKAVHT